MEKSTPTRNDRKSKPKHFTLLPLLSLCVLALACVLSACSGNAADSSSNAHFETEPPPVSSSPEPSVSVPQATDSLTQPQGIVIAELIGEIYATGGPYTIKLVASEEFDYPGSSGTKAYKDILLHVFGNGKDETISLSTNGTDYVDPELSLFDFTGDGISDVFVKLPVAGVTRPEVSCYMFSNYNGRLREILNPELLASLLTYTVTYYDNYILKVAGSSSYKTFLRDFSDAYQRYPDWFHVSDGELDTAPMYDETGRLNPDRPPWEPEKAVVSDAVSFLDENRAIATMNLVIKQDIWSGATGDTLIGSAISFVQWNETSWFWGDTGLEGSTQIFDPESKPLPAVWTNNISEIHKPNEGGIIPALGWLNEIGKTVNDIKAGNPDAYYQNVRIISATGECLGVSDNRFCHFFFGSQDALHLSDLSDEFGDQLRCAGVASTIGELYPDTIDQMPLEQFLIDNGISEYRYELEYEGLGWIQVSGDGWLVWIDTRDEGIGFDDYKEITTMKRSYNAIIVNEEIYNDNLNIIHDKYYQFD